jgi:hypothetical protein
MEIGTGSALCSAILLVASTAFAAPAVEWTSAVPLADEQWASEVLPVADGYVTVGGDVRQPADPVLGGSMACALAKTDLAGVLLWHRSYSNSRMSTCNGVEPAAGGGFVLVGTAYHSASAVDAQIVVIRTDAAGNQLWAKFFDANDGAVVDCTLGFDVKATADGGFVVLGLRGAAPPVASPVMLVKIDADGNELWRTFPGDTNAETFRLNANADGGFILGGWRYVGPVDPPVGDPADYQAWMLRVDADGKRVWSADYPVRGANGMAALQTPDGGFALVGYTGGVEGMIATEALLLKVDAAGALQWSTGFGGPGDDMAFDLAIAPDGGILVVGSQAAPYTAALQEEMLAVTKFTADGAKRWEVFANGAPAGRSGWASGSSIVVTADGGAITAGSAHVYDPASANDGSCDTWIVKLAPEAALPPVAVRIDVRPGSDVNPINLSAQGTVPVAILTTGSFDAATVDRPTVRFAGAPVATKPNGRLQWSLEDVDGDGDADLLLHFRIADLRLAAGDTTATLTGAAGEGAEISGTDTVKVTKLAASRKTPVVRPKRER